MAECQATLLELVNRIFSSLILKTESGVRGTLFRLINEVKTFVKCAKTTIVIRFVNHSAAGALTGCPGGSTAKPALNSGVHRGDPGVDANIIWRVYTRCHTVSIEREVHSLTEDEAMG